MMYELLLLIIIICIIYIFKFIIILSGGKQRRMKFIHTNPILIGGAENLNKNVKFNSIHSSPVIQINDLKSKTPKWMLKMINRTITSFELPLPLDNISSPSLNDSSKTVSELNDLVKITNRRSSEQTKFYQQLNQQSIIKFWINYAGMNGLKYDDQYLSTLVQDLETLIVKIKLFYNRPRPCILSYLHGLKLNYITDCCSNSPSYPSKSTFISNVLAYVLSVLNPDRQSEITSLAKKIELVNLYSGTHYKSDLDTANLIADIVKPYLKITQ